MAGEGNSVLSQNAIDSLFGDIAAGDPVIDPGASTDGVTRAPTVGDIAETAVAEPPPAAPAAPAAPVDAVAPPPAQQMPDARPWLQEGPPAAAPAPAAPPPVAAPAAVAPAPAPVDPALAVPQVAAAPVPVPAAPVPAAAPVPIAPPVAPVAQAAPPAATVEAGISGDDVEAMIAPLQATLAAYEKRFAGIDVAIAKIADLEKAISESGKGGVERRDLHLLQGKIMKQMRSVVDNLQATPAYGLRKTFACSGCGEVGHVAVRVKCTSCERDTHVGWFPDEASGGKKPQAGHGGRSNPRVTRTTRVRSASNGRKPRKARPGQGRAPR